MTISKKTPHSSSRKPIGALIPFVLTVSVLLTGCGPATEPAETPAQPNLSFSSAEGPTDPASGITYEEAERNNVLAADGDAQLLNLAADWSEDGEQVTVTADVRNVSNADDTYLLFISTSIPGQTATQELTVSSGATEAVTVVVPVGIKLSAGTELELKARLDGHLLGQGVAEKTLTLTQQQEITSGNEVGQYE